MNRVLLLAFVALGCSRADEKSLRRVVEERFQRYAGSRDRVTIERCAMTPFPATEEGWLRFKFPDYWQNPVTPPAGVCNLRFDFDTGHGERHTMTREVRYVFMDGSWHQRLDPPLAY
jgi:hypothetical protein